MKKYLIATHKSWNIANYEKHFSSNTRFHLITDKVDLNLNKLREINPDYIFFPHWSYIIKKEVFENYNCVVFHMTDLPYGRGGSPLQNLITLGHQKTKISAIKVTAGLDEGPIYFKEDLSLEGTATEIFKRCSDTIFEKMIPKFFDEVPIPKIQEGTPTIFNRRKPEDSEISSLENLSDVYDYIRMLDAEGYPLAYLETNNFIFEFKDATLSTDEISASVTIKRKK